MALAGDWAGVALVVFFRVGGVMATLPGFGEQVISVRVRLMLTLIFAAVLIPALADTLEPPPMSAGFVYKAMLTETVTGVFLGVFLRLFIFAIQTAGSIAAQSTSLSQLMGQAQMDPLPAIGHILTTAALALLMATGFPLKVIAFFALSYEIFPPLAFPDSVIVEYGAIRVSECFALAFTLAAPFIIMALLYYLTLGVINKAMPQLMVAFVGAPVITMGSIFMLFITAPLVLTVWVTEFESFLLTAFR